MEGKKEHRKLTLTSTKQEMLQAYNTLLKEFETRQEGELKPENRSMAPRLGSPQNAKIQDRTPRRWIS